MANQENNKAYPSGTESDYKLIEYQDFFITSKNKRIALKSFGEKSAQLNSYFLEYLKGYNIPSAFVKKGDKKSLLFLKVDDFPFRVKILNSADSRTAKIFSIKPGLSLELPIQEYNYGDSRDSVITESHLISFNICSFDDLKLISRLCSKINAIVKSFFDRRSVSLVELTCRFGKFDGKLYLIGDFSPASIKVVSNKLDKILTDPYKIETFAQMKKYTDNLLKLTNGD